MAPRRRSIIVIAGIAVIAVLAVWLWRQYDRSWRWSITVVESRAFRSEARFDRFRFDGGDRSRQFDTYVVRFPLRSTKVLLHDLSELKTQPLQQLALDASAIVSINGGYFDPEANPVGLLRIEGREVQRATSKPLLSGALVIDGSGRLSVVARDDPRVRTAPSARQVGPFIIDPGGTIGVSRDPSAVAERTVVAVCERADTFAVITTTPTTLYDLACCLKKYPAALWMPEVERAINLDGGPSTGSVVMIPGTAPFIQEPRGPIRDAVLFYTQ